MLRQSSHTCITVNDGQWANHVPHADFMRYDWVCGNPVRSSGEKESCPQPRLGFMHQQHPSTESLNLSSPQGSSVCVTLFKGGSGGNKKKITFLEEHKKMYVHKFTSFHLSIKLINQGIFNWTNIPPYRTHSILSSCTASCLLAGLQNFPSLNLCVRALFLPVCLGRLI